MCLKAIVLRISVYMNHTLAFFFGDPANVSAVFNFRAISFLVWMRLLWTPASALGPLPDLPSVTRLCGKSGAHIPVV